MFESITLTAAQVVTIASEMSDKAKEVRIATDEDSGIAGAVLVTYDAGWGTLTLCVYPDGSHEQAGMGVTVPSAS